MKPILYFFILIMFFFETCLGTKNRMLFWRRDSGSADNFRKKVKSNAIQWIQVNTYDSTWNLKGKELICSGSPVGVIRTANEYENFHLHIEWKHNKAGGNSGVFVWSKAVPSPNRLPDGVEAQMLELEWIRLHTKEGNTPPEARVHGEMFGMGGVQIVADNPSGNKSFPVEFRCKGKGEWNTYDLVCVDGTIKLAVNGKFVNGLSKSSQQKGFICLESEGSDISFRNIRVTILP
ncbi:MAG: DUF1080 domain-containing protein [Bacteroidetes bacterium]|nr:DUF1080 domain-containing protein [Bacteroidota bacterium]